MKFCFRKRIDGVIHSVLIQKNDSGDRISISVEKDGCKIGEPINKPALSFDEMTGRYNSGMIGNVRSTFNCLFPSDFDEIVRVIGITNHLVHYFCFFQSEEFSIKCFNEYINNLKGFTFVDWEEVSKGSSNQLLYMSTDDYSHEWKEECDLYFEKGAVGKIEYTIGQNSGNVYWFDSKILNSGRSKMISELRNKVNATLLKRFPKERP